MDAPLSGRVALVTGASRGMGRAIALTLASLGADVAVNYRVAADAAAEVVATITATGRRAVALQADVADPPAAEGLAAATVAALGPIDVLVNNAGIGVRPPALEQLTLEEFRRTIDVNLTPAFVLTQAVLPSMRARGWGRVINIASTAAQTGGSVGPHYAASKAGLIGLTHGFATLVVRDGVTVNAIAMAQIDTDLLRAATAADPGRIPVGRFGTVEEVASVAAMLATNAYMTGQTVSPNGGMYYTS
ncbi:MAG: SDR family NAD(P)-dependent oxidoreductase [Acidimicrobiales bacterium]